MAWIEQVEGWKLTITGTDYTGASTVYYGSGSRLFIESDGTGCKTALPSIGDTMEDPYTSTSYTNIVCTEKTFERTHSAGAVGLTCTLTYAGEGSGYAWTRDAEAGSFSADLTVLDQKGGMSWFWYTDNAKDGNTTDFTALQPIPDANFGGPAAENLPFTLMQITRTKRITFSSDAKLEAWLPKVQTYGGKLNNDTFLNFEKGQVLLGAISGSKNNNIWEVDVVFIIRKIPDPTITKDDWNFMPFDQEGQEKWHRPVKGIAEVSPGAGFLGANAYAYMYEYEAIENILDTGGA